MVDGERAESDPFARFPIGVAGLIERVRARVSAEAPEPATGLVGDGGLFYFAAANVLTDYDYSGETIINMPTGSILVVTRAEGGVDKGDVRVLLQLGEGLPRAAANAVQIEQVVLNLPRNGIEAYHEAGEGGELVVQTRRDDGQMIEVAVVDHGDGLPRSDADKGFDAFYTTKPSPAWGWAYRSPTPSSRRTEAACGRPPTTTAEPRSTSPCRARRAAVSTQSKPAVQRDGIPRTGPSLEAAPRPDGRPPTRTSIPLGLSAAAVAAAYFAAALAGGEILRTTDPAVALWPAGGILFAILVRTNFSAWPLTVAGCAAASFAATTVLGEGALLSLGMAVINMAEVLVPAVLLRRVFDTPIALGTLGEGAGFLVATVVLGPAAGAVIAAGLGGALEGAGLWQVWQAWFGTHAVGMIVVAPALITWTPQYLADFRAPRHALEATLFVTVLAAVTFLVFGGSVAPGGFVALLLWAAFRFGTFGCAATALAVVSFLLASHTVGMGPISIFLSELPIENRMLFVKLAMANVVLTPMAVAIVVAERRRAAEEIRRLNEGLEDRVRERVAAYERSQEALSESEERTRRLVETMNEGLGILDTDGALTYVNDRMCHMIGHRPEELLGRRFVDLMDPDGPRPADDALAPRERRAPTAVRFPR